MVEIIVERGSKKDRDVNFTNFSSTRSSKSSGQYGSRKYRDLVDDERSQFHSPSIDGIARDIRDRRSRIGNDVIQGERSEFHSLSIEGTFRIISTVDLEKTESVEGKGTKT